MKLVVSTSVKTPNLKRLMNLYSPAGMVRICKRISDRLKKEVEENIRSGGKKSWANWKQLAKSTVYKRRVDGKGASRKPLQELKKKVYATHSSTSATVGVRSKVAVFQHKGTPLRQIFPKRIGESEGTKPLFFPFPGGKIRWKGWRWHRTWVVEAHSIPARPLVPPPEKVKELGKEIALDAIRRKQ